MLFATKKEEIESAIVREAYRQKWEGFAYDFPNVDGSRDHAHVAFSWPLPRNGSPLTVISVVVEPDMFDSVDYAYIQGAVLQTQSYAQQQGFSPQNPFSVRRVDRNWMH